MTSRSGNRPEHRTSPMAVCRFAVVAVLATLVACTGDDDAPRSATDATVSIGALPPDSVASTPGTATPVPRAVGAGHAATIPDVTGGPTFRAAALLAPTSRRGWLLVGTGRAAPGAPDQLALYVSPDGAAWTSVAVDAPEHSSAAAAVTLDDGNALIAGVVDGDTGPRPVVWQVTDWSANPPEPIGDLVGAPTAITVGQFGNPMVAVTAVGSDGTPSAVIAALTGEGWRTTALDAPAEVAGIVATETGIIVTGSVSDAPPTTSAAAWRSTDGGESFAPADTAALRAPGLSTALGPVVATSSGFAAASCSPGGAQAQGGLATSTDGAVWIEAPLRHPRGVVPTVGGGCGTIAADDDGVWLASTAGEPVVFRVVDGLVDRLGVPTRPPGTIFEGAPLVAVSDGVVVAAVPQPGGVATSAARAVSLTTDLELDVAMPGTAGVPTGSAQPSTVTALDDRGTVIGVGTYPVVIDEPDGSYRWTTELAAFGLDAEGIASPQPDAAPRGPNGSLGGIVATRSEEVAIATVPDADPLTAFTGDVVASRRAVGGAWSARTVIAGGPGRQAVSDVVAMGDDVVAVGSTQVVTQPDPLVVVGDGRTFRTLGVTGDVVSFSAVCRLDDSTVLALGAAAIGGASAVATFSPGSRAVDARPGPPGPAPRWCASEDGGVLVASDRTIATTTDGVLFQPVDVLGPGERVVAVASGRAGVAVVGTTASGDGFLFVGPRAEDLQRVAEPSLVGPGAQTPTDVVVRRDDIVVVGLINGAPTTWRVPLN